MVAYLGQMDEAGRLGVAQVASGARGGQGQLGAGVCPRWVTVDLEGMRVERCLEFGGPWLGLALLHRLGLMGFFQERIAGGQEWVPRSLMAAVLVLSRWCHPASELSIAEHYYGDSALVDLLGVSADRVNEDRLYRAMDALLPHKEALEVYLKERLGELFQLEYDLLLYDVTSTYFEGQAAGNPLAARGYSRDHRPDCKQVCIALVVSRCGMPLGYEVFAGNRNDVTTVEEIVQTMEGRYGRADRIWVMDRGMVSEGNLRFLQSGGRRYIVGTPKSQLREFKRDLLAEDWRSLREGLEVKLCRHGEYGEEVFILCRSRDRREKEKAMHERFEGRIVQGLTQMEESCRRKRQKPVAVAKRVGRLLGANRRAAGLFATDVVTQADGSAKVVWSKVKEWQDWASLSEGCYLLRSNVTDWSAEELWQAYIQLTEAEAAFRIEKSDLRIRPIWHQKPQRVAAHILVCFLAYVLWKTLGQMCRRAGLGDEPRRVFEEIKKIRLVDVVLPTNTGATIRWRCITRPTDHQAILLDRLGLNLPTRLEITERNGIEM